MGLGRGFGFLVRWLAYKLLHAYAVLGGPTSTASGYHPGRQGAAVLLCRPTFLQGCRSAPVTVGTANWCHALPMTCCLTQVTRQNASSAAVRAYLDAGWKQPTCN